MEIIRDEEINGLMMIPLFSQLGVTRCNVRDCKEKQTTIITGATEQPFGLCEKHYNECKKSGKLNYTLDFCEVSERTICSCGSCTTEYQHQSDCAVHNMPAMPNGKCDCR